jgi:Protein of unknown function (DUF3179)
LGPRSRAAGRLEGRAPARPSARLWGSGRPGRSRTLQAILLLAAASPWACRLAPAGGSPRLVACPDLFETLVNPRCSHLADEDRRRPGELRPEERVLAWIRGYSEGGCIPYRFFFSRYPVVSDTYGVFVCDPDAGFARAFEPSLDFTFHGYRNGVLVLRHKNGTLYSALSGRAFEGPDRGKRLRPIPSLTTTWGHWFRAYPRAVMYELIPAFQRAEFAPERSAERSRESRAEGGPAAGGLLAGEEEVLGVEAGGESSAYPTRLFRAPRSRAVIEDRLGEVEVVVLWYAPTGAAAAYSPFTEGEAGRRITLVEDGSDPLAPFRDRETGSTWGVEGRARSGPLAGKTLRWLPSVQCRWYAFRAEFPGALIHPSRG